jgi:hypothetical protein
MLRIDPANHILGLRINVFTSVIVFLGAVLFLILRRHVGREDPTVVWGPDRPARGEPESAHQEPTEQESAGAEPDDAGDHDRDPQDVPASPTDRGTPT